MKNNVVEEKRMPPVLSVSRLTSDLVRGGLVGCVTISTVTPLMNFTNYVLAKQNPNQTVPAFTVKRAFDGLLAYNASVVPMIGVSLVLNSLFVQAAKTYGEQDKMAAYQWMASTVSGAAAGAVGALPEGIAQVQQRSKTKPGAFSVISNVVQQNGYSALTRGVGATMLRQPIFTVGYMNLMPILSQKLQDMGCQKVLSECVSALLVGLVIGPLTAPPNTLRFQRQLDFHKKQTAPSYVDIYRTAQKSGHTLGFFMQGAKPRSLMTAASMLLLHKGKEAYDEVSTEISHGPS